MSLTDLDNYESRKAIFEEEKSRSPKEPSGDVKKEYCVGCFQKSDWEFIHAELMKDGSLEDNIPTDKCECVNDCLQSDVRGIYLLTDTEAIQLRSNSKVDYVNVNICAYPGTYRSNPDDLVEVSLTDRYSSNVKNQQKITNTSGGIRENFNSDKLNRCSAQLYRHSAKKNPWVTLGDPTSVVNSKLPQYGTGLDVDVIVCDQDMWFGHIEFCNPSAITNIKTYDASQGDGVGGNASTEAPSNYVGGNALRSGFSSSSTTGMCDLLDLVLDAPYYLDSAWFEASPSTRLTTRWDGTKVPVESVAKEWWSDASKRSAAYASIGTVTPDSGAIINQATPYVRLYVGDTVNFNMSNVGNEHAFYIKTSNTSGTGDQVTTPAATGQGANGNSTTSWTPNTAGIYYIRCANHSMIGYINVKDNPCTGTGSVSTFDITITASGTSAWFGNGPHRGEYNRDRCNGTNKSYKSGFGSHGTPCASQAYGRQYGWAYNANKWFLNLYGSGGVYWEVGFDLQKIFHQTKPTHPTHGNKNPTISSNSWGRRFSPSTLGSSGYYFYRPASIDGTTTGVQYTSWDADGNTDGTGGTAPRFMTNRTLDFVGNAVQCEPISGSTMTAANEMTAAGVIFVCSAGNRNQKCVKSTHSDYNNYVGSGSNSSLSSTQFYRSYDGLTYHKTLNRGGFPAAFNNSIVIGALDDDFSSGKERKVNYSGTGDAVDLYSAADDTFAASDNRRSGYSRYDSFYTYNSVQSPRSYDRYFNGTSSACPVAVGLIATKLQYNRTWTSANIKSWLSSIGQQDTNDFYYGNESTSANDTNWSDKNSIQGGLAIVPFDTAIDTTNPTLSSSVPSNNATGVAIDTNIVLNFSESVDAESGNIVIYKASDDSVIETIDVTSGQVTGSGTSQITINPSSDLANDTVFYVQIATTAFDDAGGNSYAGILDKTSLRFTTVVGDTTNPTLSSSVPSNNATEVALNANIVLNFSEAVDVESGNIVIYKASDDSVIETISVTSGQVTGGGTSQITINPSGNLETNTTFYIKIDATAFDDAAGNSYAGISDKTSLRFTTVDSDITNPTLSSSVPSNNATGVAINTNIVLNFSEEVIAQSGGNIVIYKASDDSVIETISVTSGQVTGSGTSQITINPSSDLANDTVFYVQISATAFDDASGNSYAGISNKTSLRFTTVVGDTTNPTLNSSSPSNGATGVAIDTNIVLNFSEAVDTESGNIVIHRASDDYIVETIDVTSNQVTGSGTSQITINPSGNLATNTTFYIQIAVTAFDDAAGNSYAGISDKTSLRFRTVIPPDPDPPNVEGEYSVRFTGNGLSFGGQLVIK